jgi:hypothetical protein
MGSQRFDLVQRQRLGAVQRLGAGAGVDDVVPGARRNDHGNSAFITVLTPSSVCTSAPMSS